MRERDMIPGRSESECLCSCNLGTQNRQNLCSMSLCVRQKWRGEREEGKERKRESWIAGIKLRD